MCVNRGLVDRRTDPRDRRTARIFLAPPGEALRHLRGFYKDVNAVLQDDMSEAEIKALYALLEQVAENARRADQASSDTR